MRRIPAALMAAFLLASAPSWGADIAVTVAKITGKAQLQKGADWVPLTPGQKLGSGDTVSTGFRSELLLQIGPSTVTVKALSRVTLQNLTQEGTSLKTDLYLKVGKVSAEVNKSESVQSQKFQVASPVATASVRGTAFSFDGTNLQVSRGLVDFSDLRGNKVSIPVGEAARVAAPGSRQGIVTNQKLVAQESVVAAKADAADALEDEATLSWNGWTYADLLDLLYGWDWYGDGGWSEVYINGIDPLPLPSATYLTIGGIDQLYVPAYTAITLGGIDP